jgi:hypothetical protein
MNLNLVADRLAIWAAKQATCSNTNCPVPFSIRREKCTLYEIAGNIRASTFDVIDEDFLSDDGVQARLKQDHCLKLCVRLRDGKVQKLTNGQEILIVFDLFSIYFVSFNDNF